MAALALGTVQFGLSYGVANRTGQVTLDEARRILDRAVKAGIDTLDTAIAYGESEAKLGQLGVADWRVVTKLPPIPLDCADVGKWVDENIRGSLSRLHRSRLSGLLLHRSADLLGAQGDLLYSALVRAREQGQVEKLGVSVYSPADLASVADRFRLDLVQAPFSIVDRRLATSGWLKRLSDQGVEVHVRSAFLQGLLLMRASERPARFLPWNPLWQRWESWLSEMAMTPLQACLAFALSQPEISRVVVGVDRDAQLADILDQATTRPVFPPEELASEDPQLINPLSWIT